VHLFAVLSCAVIDRCKPHTYASLQGTDTILKLVQSLTKQQLLEILSEMKKFSTQNPEGARQLLHDSPQVAQTLLHILILFGLVRPGDVAAIQTMQRPIAGASAVAPTLAPAPVAPVPAVPAAGMYPPPQTAGAYAPPPSVAVAAPPVPVPAPAAGVVPASAVFTEQDTFMLREIMKLSPDQVRQLPQEVQDKIRLLQQQMQLDGAHR
jgi:hypothetical protein